MNKFDLQLLFEDKVGSLMTDTNKTFKTSEIERFLNAAMDLYFAQLAEIYEVNEDARKALTNLVLTEEVLPEGVTPAGITPLNANSKFFDVAEVLDGSLYKIVEEYAEVSGEKIFVKPVTHDQYQINIRNPYKKPYSDLYWRIDVEGYVEIIPETTPADKYVYRYLTSPTKIDFTTDEYSALDLRDKDLKNIVQMAVDMALHSLGVVKQGE